MLPSCEDRDPVWLAEIREGVDQWRMLVDCFTNSGEAAIIEYLTREHEYSCYASPHGDHWSVQVVAHIGAHIPVADWVSVYTVGETLLGALSVAAGALEAIRCEGVQYTLSLDCRGVIACTA